MASSARKLVIVESPNKVAKIQSYLGKDFLVDASRGHVRDLPTSASQVPAKFKGEPWARTGVDVDHDFAPLYVVSPDKRDTVKKLKEELKQADELYLATDADREGEAIAWHLLQELKPKIPVKRMVFTEITKEAVQDALKHTRSIDTDLVDAQETRRILDRLYGYEVSPVLWRKVMPRLSAGRVQSVATRLVVDRERERMAFQPASYWEIEATLRAAQSTDAGQPFPARLVSLDGRRVARGADFDAHGEAKAGVLVLDEQSAQTLVSGMTHAQFQVSSVDARPYTRRPAAPFRTTTLTQEAGRKFGYTTDRTMRIAQELYEGGYITYMRTDSVALSNQAIQAAREQARVLYGAEYVPDRPRIYTSKVKNAQEAHEAIRPSGEHFRTPEQTGLSGDQRRLYDLIWMRTLASQMADATGHQVSVSITAEPTQAIPLSRDGSSAPVTQARFAAAGRTITFPGFLRAYVESRDQEPGDESADEETGLPALHPGQSLHLVQLTPSGHQTKPPARYTEPSLVAKLEELDIGRPSTYASIINTITSRDYVFKRGQALVPTWLAFAVTRLLERHFPNLVDYRFTADLEDLLDSIANGDAARLTVLSDFYFGDKSGAAGLQNLVNALGDIDAREISTFHLGDFDSGLNVRVGRYGAYVEDEEGHRANIPEDLAPDELTVERARELLAQRADEGRELGLDPQTHTMIVVRQGRYGPYVTEVLPDDEPEAAPKSKSGRAGARKPRTASLFPSMDPATITLEEALALLNLPRQVGVDQDGTPIEALNGRYGPYLRKGSETRSLPSPEAIFTVSLDEAQAMFAEPKQRGRRTSAEPLRDLGTDPDSGRPIQVKNGRFGPYVTDGEVNATLRRTDSVQQITLERALELLAEKRAKGPQPRRSTRRTRTTPARTSTSTRRARGSQGGAADKNSAPAPTAGGAPRDSVDTERATL